MSTRTKRNVASGGSRHRAPPAECTRVLVLVLSSTDTVAIAPSCVESSIAVLNRSPRVHASRLDVTDLSHEALHMCDVLLVTGGEPRRLRGLLSGDKAKAIRSFVAEGGGYVGVCAGAVLAAQKAPTLDLLPAVQCVNDNVWWASGLTGTVRLRRPDGASSSSSLEAANERIESLSAAFVPDPSVPSGRAYYNGPLFSINAPKKQKRPKKPTVREREEMEMAMAWREQGPSSSSLLPETAWADPFVLAVFHGHVKPWSPDPDAPRRPRRDEMDGAVAALAGRHKAGVVVLSSVHPEFDDVFESESAPEGRLLEEMCLFAAQV